MIDERKVDFLKTYIERKKQELSIEKANLEKIRDEKKENEKKLALARKKINNINLSDTDSDILINCINQEIEIYEDRLIVLAGKTLPIKNIIADIEYDLEMTEEEFNQKIS